MSEQNEPVVEVNPDAARSRVRNFVTSRKVKGALLATAGAALFIAGRRSKDVVESVDVDVNLADDSSNQD